MYSNLGGKDDSWGTALSIGSHKAGCGGEHGYSEKFFDRALKLLHDELRFESNHEAGELGGFLQELVKTAVRIAGKNANTYLVLKSCIQILYYSHLKSWIQILYLNLVLKCAWGAPREFQAYL